MHGSFRNRLAPLAVLLLAGLGLAGCSSTTDRVRGALDVFTPYKSEVVQGNFVSKEQIAALRPGMTREQVREVLGTSLLVDVFHPDRWDYAFTIRRQGVEPQQRRLTVLFKGDEMLRFEGDAMPSEEEFVATLDTRKGSRKVPELQASEEQLNRLNSPNPKPVEPAASTSTAPLPAVYPPLEPGR